MAIVIGEIVGNLGLNTKQFESKLKSMEDLGKSMIMKVTAPIIAGFGLAIKAASDAEETASKFATIYRDIGNEAESAFQKLRTEYGLSSTASKQLLGDTGDLLTGFGFSQRSALDLSLQVQELAVDLASFTNFSGGAEGASQALTKALLGERESVKALGISILEEDVKKQMAINTAKGLTFATERQAKAQATLDIAISQSQNAIGDYARTSGDFVNQTRLLQARVGDLAVEFGQVLLPVARKIVAIIQDVVSWVQKTDKSTLALIGVIGGLAAAIGPAIFLIAKLGSVIAFLVSPVGVVIAGLTALTVAIAYVADNWNAIIERVSDIGWWRNALIDMVQWFLRYNPTALLIEGFNAVLDTFGKSIPNPFRDWADDLDGLRAETKVYENEFGNLTDALKNGLKAVTGIDLKSIFDAPTETPIVDTIQTVTTEAGTMGRAIENALKPMVALNLPPDAIASPFKIANYALMDLDELMSTSLDNFEGLDTIAVRMSPTMELLGGITDNFVNSFGQGMANVIVQGEKLIDTLKNIGKLLLSSAIQTGISIFLSGGLTSAGTGFFGSGGGLFGKLFGRASGGSVNAMQPYMVGERGPELFMPNIAGGIVPNHAMSGLTGSKGNGLLKFEIEGTKLIALIRKSEIQFS